MSAGALVVVVLFLGLAFTFGLYALIREETSNPRVVDRATAEREAQERGGLGDRSRGDRTGSPNTDRETGDDDGWGSLGRRDE
ncbi:hypothetical protein [Natronobeatus ordinarius]|uniref:hypothetical protein n=1 Tax=Natronobeatus ordinarius TaxID=2963433 RepID=UPI0020CE3322|nr:hypothetical protein [Natronobeatus ordinarius]